MADISSQGYIRPAIKSVQRGYTYFPIGTTDITISAVDVDKCFILCSNYDNRLSFTFVSPTTMRVVATANLTRVWSIIEFY